MSRVFPFRLTAVQVCLNGEPVLSLQPETAIATVPHGGVGVRPLGENAQVLKDDR